MRTKEDAHDYRYFPEPDLPPLRVPAGLVDRVRASLPELPEALRLRFVGEYGLSHEDAMVLTATRDLARFFEDAAKRSGNARASANWIRNELVRELDARRLDVAASPVTAERLAALVAAVDSERVSGAQAKQILVRMVETGRDVDDLVDELGGGQINDEAAIRAIVADVLAANPKQVEQYRAGKEALFGFFVGQVMKASDKKANAKIANDLLRETLK
jgi:aspartyl-tRNA(Asn)/glutamyl-tRNA(Gln) amidotransferase subunit B